MAHYDRFDRRIASQSKEQILDRDSKNHFRPFLKAYLRHLTLDLSLQLQEKYIQAKAKYRFEVMTSEISELRLEALDLKIMRVSSGKKLFKYHQSDESVVIDLNRSYKKGTFFELQIDYEIKDPRAGLHFIEDTQGQVLQVWSQGQDEDNRHWIPLPDYPETKFSLEIKINIDTTLCAISNGSLCDIKSSGKRKTYSYVQTRPLSPYLISLVVGDMESYQEVWKSPKGRKIPLEYLTPRGRLSETRHSFRNTSKMMTYFSQIFDCEYPYDKYSQTVALEFIYGGMENTSATTQTEWTLHGPELSKEFSSDYLVAHELAHQWFGDLVTCRSWAHAWLHESFATYAEVLWMDHHEGALEAQYELWNQWQLFHEEDGSGHRRPLVVHQYRRPSDIFDRHLYEKGSLILHMLRRHLGEDAWWGGLKSYLSKFKDGHAETIDLQRCFEESYGGSLEDFFFQWTQVEGYPSIQAETNYSANDRALSVSLKQKQKHLIYTNIVVPLKIVFKDGTSLKREVVLNKVDQTFVIDCQKEPLFVSFNSEGSLFWQIDYQQETAAELALVESKEFLRPRLEALYRLKTKPERPVIEFLEKLFKKEKFWGFRFEIALILGDLIHGSVSDVLNRLLKTEKNPKVRSRIIASLVKHPRGLKFEDVLKQMTFEKSPVCQQAWGELLSEIDPERALDAFKALYGQKEPTWRDSYHVGILKGLKSVCEKGYDVRSFFSMVANDRSASTFARLHGVRGLVASAARFPSLVKKDLLGLMNDSNYFVKIEAVGGLAEMEDVSSLATLETFYQKEVDPRLCQKALASINKIRNTGKSSEQLKKLQAELDSLKSQLSEIRQKAENSAGNKKK